MSIIRASWSIQPDGRCAPIRALTITGMNLVADNEAYEQVSLFDGGARQRDRLERLERAMARIRARYGAEYIGMGWVESEELGIRQFGRGGHAPRQNIE